MALLGTSVAWGQAEQDNSVSETRVEGSADLDGAAVVECRPGRVISESEPIPVPADRTTTIRVPGSVAEAESRSASWGKIVANGDLLFVKPHKSTLIGTQLEATLRGGGLGELRVTLKVVANLPAQASQWLVMRHAEIRAEQERRAREDGFIRRAERDRGLADAARRRFAGDARFYATTQQRTWRTDPVRIRLQSAELHGTEPEEFLLPIEITAKPRVGAPVVLEGVEVWDDDNFKQLDARVVYVEAPNTEGALAKLSAGQRAQVAVAFQLPQSGEIPTLRVVLRRPGKGFVSAMGTDWAQKTEEEKAQEEYERHREEIRQLRIAEMEAEEKEIRDRELAKRTWIGVHGLYGAIWLDDGVSMPARTDATNLAGFGVRVMKGLFPMSTGSTPMLAFEADLALASSGTSRFDDVVIDGMAGDLQRTAKLVRVQVGGALRFGDPISAMVRVGVGGQGVSQGSELLTLGGPIAVLDSSIDVAGAFYVGGGVDARLGGFIAGIGLSLIQVAGGQRSLEGSVNVAYRL
jgi:hypothetical protein